MQLHVVPVLVMCQKPFFGGNRGEGGGSTGWLPMYTDVGPSTEFV